MDLNSLLHAHNKIMADRATNTTVRNNNTADHQQADIPPPAYSTLTSHHPPTTATLNSTPTPDDPDDLYATTSSTIPSPPSTSGATTPAQTLAIDAATLVHGSNNIITVPPVDGPRLTAILLSLLHGNLPTQQAATAARQQAQPVHHAGRLPGSSSSRRPLSVRINCGVRVVGNRNVLGGAFAGQQQAQQAHHPGQQQQQAGGGGARVAGRNGNAAAVARNAAGGAAAGERQEAGGRKRKAGEEEEEEAEDEGRGDAEMVGVKRERVGGGGGDAKD